MGSTTYLAQLAWETGDIAGIINQAMAEYQAVELPAGRLPGKLKGPLVAKKNGQKLLGRSTHIMVEHSDVCFLHPGDLVSSYPEISRIRFERTLAPTVAGHGIHVDRIVEKMLIAEVHVIGSQHGFLLGPTDDSMLDHCTAERNAGCGFRILPMGPTPMALQWSSRDCRALLNQGAGMHIQAFPLAGHTGGLACGTHEGFTTWHNEDHGIVLLGSPLYPLHEPRFRSGFLGDDRLNLIFADCGADLRLTDMRLELPRERHGIYLSPGVRHAWLKGLTLTGARRPGTYGIYADAGQQFFHLSDSEIYHWGASGVYSNSTLGWINGLQSAENGNYGLFLEHPNFRVYALSCYGNGMGDFGGPTPGVFI